MAITKTWTIETLERDVSDGFVLYAIWNITGKDGDTIIDNVRTGTVQFEKPITLPSDFIPYEKLDESTVISWVKSTLGTEIVQQEEAKAIRLTALGKPF